MGDTGVEPATQNGKTCGLEQLPESGCVSGEPADPEKTGIGKSRTQAVTHVTDSALDEAVAVLRELGREDLAAVVEALRRKGPSGTEA